MEKNSWVKISQLSIIRANKLATVTCLLSESLLPLTAESFVCFLRLKNQIHNLYELTDQPVVKGMVFLIRVVFCIFVSKYPTG